MGASEAWALACRLFASGTPVRRSMLSPGELSAVRALGSAVRPVAVDQRFLLCPYCMQHAGAIYSAGGDDPADRICRCPDCGPVPVAAQDLVALGLDEGWLRTKLRLALDINSRDGIEEVDEGVWRLGDAKKAPVLLARDLLHVWGRPSLLDRMRPVSGRMRVIAPRPGLLREAAFGPSVEWLPLEDRFSLYGGGVTARSIGIDIAPQEDPSAPVHGPFSDDFRWVTVEGWTHGPIHCTEGQAAVFRALWSFKGVPVSAQRIMERAGLSSDKLVDVFKVKTQDKGKPKTLGAKWAYDTLVTRNRREGLYWLAGSYIDSAHSSVD